MTAASVWDYRAVARRRLPRILFEYIDGGSYAETTLARNVEDFTRILLRQRVMQDMSELDMGVTALGMSLSLPLGLAPVGLVGMYRRRGEAQGARAAARAGIPMCLSTLGVCSLEEVAATGTPAWQQLYIIKDRGHTRELIARAKAAGAPALILTVDLPLPGARYRDVRSGFTGGAPLRSAITYALDGLTHPAWLWDVWVRGRPHALGQLAGAVTGGMSDYLAWIGANFDRSLTWQDVAWVREAWDGPLVIKGVLDVEDAREAVRSGVQGLIVSNHGGRQLDGVRSSISALAPIVQAVGGAAEVYLDGGVRSGLDVLKAAALGARVSFVGRPWAYAVAAHGEAGVSRMVAIIRAELEAAMVLTGCRSIAQAGRELLDLRDGA